MENDGFRTGEDPSSFDQVSGGVDEHGPLLRPLVQHMISLAALGPGKQLLDVGCGTGIVANQAARRVGPQGRVAGLDISEGMLVLARAEATRRGVNSWVDYQFGDAEALPFSDSSFDAVTCLFTFMHLSHPERAIGEMYRVLSPQGMAIIGVGSGASRTLRGQAYRVLRLMDWIDEKRGRVLTAPDFLNSLVRKHFQVDGDGVVPAEWTHPGQTLARLFTGAGFRGLRYDWEGTVAPFADPEEFWEVQNMCSSFARQRLAQAPPEHVAGLRSKFLKECETVLSRGGRLVYPIGALFVSGRRP